MSSECVCDATAPVCPKCGRRWDYMRRWSNGDVTYTSAEVKRAFQLLYGKNNRPPFERVPR